MNAIINRRKALISALIIIGSAGLYARDCEFERNMVEYAEIHTEWRSQEIRTFYDMNGVSPSGWSPSETYEHEMLNELWEYDASALEYCEDELLGCQMQQML